MTDYSPISCELHDYLEIACMHRYPLLVERREAPDCLGVALDVFGRHGGEYLRLSTRDGVLDVRLDNLVAITPTEEQARFGRVEYRI
ncbi:Rho-binding antiterminator [Chitiniphilus eburneus]|uniref:Transcriptional antiterminator n=1 Tax=Chitiniphilus eburneus TaxID=2571148 RepID=A0A4U0Q8X2_9NEIS|nr:Rho-binding antiterminator [Chitiniphilus eburneus]TJZ77655.1 transcriptional antiterminator [Chitiniphilus eburneus]